MKKIQPFRKDSFIGRLIKAIGKDSGFALHLPFQEKDHTGNSIYSPHYDFHSKVRKAMLEAEEQKAKAIMDYQRSSLVR